MRHVKTHIGVAMTSLSRIAAISGAVLDYAKSCPDLSLPEEVETGAREAAKRLEREACEARTREHGATMFDGVPVDLSDATILGETKGGVCLIGKSGYR